MIEVLNVNDLVVLVDDDIHYQHVYKIIEVNLEQRYYHLNNGEKFGLKRVRLATQEEIRLNNRLDVESGKEFIEVSPEEALNLCFKNEEVWVKFRDTKFYRVENTTKSIEMFQDLENSFYIKVKPINFDDYEIDEVYRNPLLNPDVVNITFSNISDAKKFRDNLDKYLTRRYS